MAAKRQGSVQIRQIAEALGVSVGTVSIVLNGRGDVMRISKETQKRVRDMANELSAKHLCKKTQKRGAREGGKGDCSSVEQCIF